LTEDLDDGVESEFSEELPVFACLVDCSGTLAPLAALLDKGSSKDVSGRACFLLAATGAATIGDGADTLLNNTGDAV
jgi:hypothetical protein